MVTYKKIKDYFNKYERFLIPGMLVLGVAVDFVTFRTINLKTAFILLAVQFILAGSAIAFINIFDEYRRIAQNRFLKYLRLAAPLILQFSLGALLGASLIFYWFAGTFSVSWPFILIIAALMVSNELLRDYFTRPIVQISVYYFAIFSILLLALAFTFNSISVWIFLLSGVLSLAIIFTYLQMLSKFLRFIRWDRPRIGISVVAIFILMNALYFLNVIPPIPLSITEAGVYHNVTRSGGDYILTAEDRSLIDKIIPGKTMHIQNGDRLYVYSSIFAPADLRTRIVHDWQYYDQDSRKWVSSNRASFNISGGREEGYRGYSLKTSFPGKRWRVSIENERGQVLGRVKFKIKFVEKATEFRTITR